MFEEITLYRLKVFREVAATQSFRAAAENLNISQPAVSAHICDLEGKLQTALLERGRTSTLTETGKIVYDYAVTTLQQASEIVRTVEEFRNGTRGRITLGATNPLGRYIVPKVYSSFKKENPYIEMVLRVGTTKQIYQMVLAREIDFGFVFGKTAAPGLSTKSIAKTEVMIVAGAEHPLAAKPAVDAEEISGYPFVTPVKQSFHYPLIAEMLKTKGIAIRECLMELEDPEGIKKVVAGSNVAIAAIEQLCVIDELRSGKLKKITLSSGAMFTDLTILARQDKPLTSLHKKFLEFFGAAVKSLSKKAFEV